MDFFFQAEDGIRDLVRSRGLGDVYKRQAPMAHKKGVSSSKNGRDSQSQRLGVKHFDGEVVTVSYPHLTLPTIYSV